MFFDVTPVLHSQSSSVVLGSLAPALWRFPPFHQPWPLLKYALGNMSFLVASSTASLHPA